jgi:hypothetical protein
MVKPSWNQDVFKPGARHRLSSGIEEYADKIMSVITFRACPQRRAGAMYVPLVLRSPAAVLVA